jgi:hypothetical protein
VEKEVQIIIRHSENGMHIDVNGCCSALDGMLAAARLLVISEQWLPDDMRAQFRADFLEELNRQRKEAMQEIENC